MYRIRHGEGGTRPSPFATFISLGVEVDLASENNIIRKILSKNTTNKKVIKI